MLPASEIRVLDINSEYRSVPSSTLMENAGKGVADLVSKKIKEVKRGILLLCGVGNNGGDGFVAARYLATKFPVSLFLLGNEPDIKTKISLSNYQKLKKIEVALFQKDSLNKIDEFISKNDVIIDAMLGIGLSGNLREPYATLVKKINKAQDKKIISVDVPTGFGTNTAVKPHYTVTFHDTKKGMNKKNCGVINIVDIGVPKKAIDYVGPGELATYYPIPLKKSHKGDNGIILIIGGGPYTGAPALTGMAALRTGCDLAFVATPKKSSNAVASYSPNLIVKELSGGFLTIKDIKLIDDLIKKCDSVVIGPGLGKHPETEKSTIELIKRVNKRHIPVVIDADAILSLENYSDELFNSSTVITPHAGEFDTLTGSKISEDIDEKKSVAKNWANKIGISIFLKGYIDILTDGKNVKLNDIHNPAMTVGGTGDVLAGIIGSLLSKGVDTYNSMRIAAFINGSAGNKVFETKSYGLLPTDIIEEIPSLLSKYIK
jgi:NAD(P)H-hydrate epimerase